MGGFGSGPQERSERQLVEDSLAIDINWLLRVGANDGSAIKVSWERQGQDVDSAACRLSGGKLGILMFITGSSGGQKSFEFQEVEITTTHCNFGGERRWLVCPGRVEELEVQGISENRILGDEFHCGRRIAKLFLPPGETQFLCRYCHNLRYLSQRASMDVRLARKAIAIRKRLGQRDFGQPFPPRPKGMHYRTYERLSAEYFAASTVGTYLTLQNLGIVV